MKCNRVDQLNILKTMPKQCVNLFLFQESIQGRTRNATIIILILSII